MNKKIIIFVLLGCLLTFITVMAFSQSSSNVQWEYRIVSAMGTVNSLTETLNRAGAEGWELVASYGNNGMSLIFKRRL